MAPVAGVALSPGVQPIGQSFAGVLERLPPALRVSDGVLADGLLGTLEQARPVAVRRRITHGDEAGAGVEVGGGFRDEVVGLRSP